MAWRMAALIAAGITLGTEAGVVVMGLGLMVFSF
jgi:hypothetical protein